MNLHVLVAGTKRMVGVSSLSNLNAPPYGTSAQGHTATESMTSFPLAEMLAKGFIEDAHFVAYSVFQDGQMLSSSPRLTKGCLGRLRELKAEVRIGALVCDIDLAPQLGKTGKIPWVDLEAEDQDAIESLLAALPEGARPAVVYRTNHGIRTLHALAQDLSPEEFPHAIAWLHGIYQARGLVCDPSCKDWTRFFRCPRVTRLEDDGGGATWDQEWFRISEIADEWTVPPAAPVNATPAPVLHVKAIGRGMPTVDECERLLEVHSPGNRRMVMTKAAKEARKLLEDHPAFHILYEKAPLAREGSRHTSLIKVIGAVVGLLHGYDWSSPELVYALFRQTLTDLGEDEPWHAKGWEQICSFWAHEDARAEVRKVEQESHLKKVETEKETLQSRFLGGVRTWLQPIVELGDGPAIDLVRKERLGVLVNQRTSLCHILRSSGHYDDVGTTRDALSLVIRDSGMDWLVPVEYPVDDGRGGTTWKQKQPKDILEDSARTFSRTKFTLRRPGNFAEFEARDGIGTLYIVPFGLRTDLPPEFSEECEEWLNRLTTPDRTSELILALTYMLAIEHGPTAAVALTGPPRTGKKMIAMSIAECFTHGVVVPGDTLTSRFNGAMINSPIIWIDEGVAKGSSGIDIRDNFRRIVTGGPIAVERKGQEILEVAGVHRIIFTANNIDAVRQLGGDRAGTEDDWSAIGERLVHFDAQQSAADYLSEHGGLEFTRGWISGDMGQPSSFKLAKHWMWHFHNSIPRDSEGRPLKLGKRLLFEGSRDSAFLGEMESESGILPDVVNCINEMLTRPKSGVAIENGMLWVLRDKVVDFAVEKAHLRGPDVRDAVRTLLARRQPDNGVLVDGVKARWRRVNARRLLKLSSMPHPRLVAIVPDTMKSEEE